MKRNHPFKIDFIDHVAIRVKNMNHSIQWYENTLGMEVFQPEEWKPFPCFMRINNFGVALFPAREYSGTVESGPSVFIDHFAFRVTRDEFLKAKNHYKTLKLDYQIQNHIYFESIYVRDPDGHTVELTCEKQVTSNK